MLHKRIQEIMDMQKPTEEADKKLVGTYMEVNGHIQYVREFIWQHNIVVVTNRAGETENVKVKSLNVWLPESGMYPLSNGRCLVLYKCPKRQWAKSFKDTYYYVELVGTRVIPRDKEVDEFYTEIYKLKPIFFWVDAGKYIYHYKNVVGYIKDSRTIVCTDVRFTQELIDWGKHA